MRTPQIPPRWLDLADKIPEKRKLEIYRQRQYWAMHDRYLHWDEFRRRPMPGNFTPEESWYIVKLIRGGGYQAIGLTDKDGDSFVFGMPRELTELLQQIDRGLGFAIGLPDAVSQPAVRDRYVINTLMEESITSSQLEGAATTRTVAKEMLRSNRPPRDRSERMILNNYLTMRRIRELRTEELTPELVFELHRRVTDGTLDQPDAAGRFRTEEELVRVVDPIDGTEYHIPPEANELPNRFRAMCDFANGITPGYFIHPVLRGIILHFWLAYDHPFYDGNGRTARALFYWSMLRQDYPLFEFISISDILLRAPIKYARAFLYTETDENDLTYFILHQADVIREAVKSLRDYLEHKKQELRAASDCLRGMQELNHRQQALLVHALREPGAIYHIGAHQRSHAVSHQTARNDLFDLVTRGLLAVRKSGRTYHFRAPSDLGDKLGKLSQVDQAVISDDTTLPLVLKHGVD